MSRLIDADALIEKAYDEAKGMAEPYDDFGTLVEWLVDKVPTIEPEPQWIKVDDKLPEDRQKCLVVAKSISDEIGVAIATSFTDLHKNDKAGWYGYDSQWGYWRIKDVIAWMPIPSPYREEGEE